MHHAAAMCVAQRIRHLQRYVECILQRKLPLPREAGPERLTRHERHHVVEQTIDLAGIIQRQDVRMAQLGRDLDLPQEAFRTKGCRELGPHHLHGDLALVLEILSTVHRRRAAASEFLLEGVAAG